MAEGNFVDRAVRRAQDDVRAQAIRYTPQPETFPDAESATWQTRKTKREVAALRDSVRYLRETVLGQQREIEALRAQKIQVEVEAAYWEREAQNSTAHLRQYELPAEARWHRELLTGEDVPDDPMAGEPDMEPVEEVR